MKKLNVIALAFVTCGMSFGAFAALGSDQSQPFKPNAPSIKVGPTEGTAGGHGGAVGDPGIGVQSVYSGKIISFSGLTRMAPKQPGNEAYVISMPNTSTSHDKMGVFNFAQVADAEVYFGEWSSTGAATDTTHTTYYSGKDVTTNMPTAGTAEYSVKGISQYNGGAMAAGTLTANFGTKSLAGNIGATNIDATIKNNATFAGEATLNEAVGKTRGHFFGDQAKNIAGVTEFSDHSKDMAFGGSRGNIAQ
ncbi:Slam-dependent surface lipoprotein [Providencia rettgeri]|uniref:Slam-dependent surface lipoprotein n=1 Tax=Providencia sp. TaxID=589 RepID=UPI0024ABC8DF|nr:transferrin-binding protein-like solute binding protein [Providencia rettgeri]ELR5233716.1 transferrin-binding protein-like solute binding protein [Providencia rettgeri]